MSAASATDADGDGAAETEIDTPTSSDVEIVGVTPAQPAGHPAAAAQPAPAAAAQPAGSGPGAEPRYEQVRAECRCVKEIVWRLQADEELDVFGHIVEQLNAALSRYRAFKFGITYVPQVRWRMYESSGDRWRKMLVVFKTDSSDDNAAMETQLISAFAEDRRCANRAPGGESAHPGCSPFFLVHRLALK